MKNGYELTPIFVGAGHRPARHCEAPVSPRYVGRYRREAIQCRGDNIRPTSYVPTYRGILRQPWIASPHITNYVSQVRWRLRNDGQGFALPCPGALRRDGRHRTQPSSKPRPHPLCGGVPPAGGGVVSPAGRNPRPNPPKPPSLESARAARRGGGCKKRRV
ncbi:MAG: hypothetical protein LBM98_08045 [Oscillospiraceae bacterium]|nr:hypothetical protein [Oscillospiraceae bacterium]